MEIPTKRNRQVKSREYYLANQEAIRVRSKEYYYRNRKTVRAKDKKRREENREALRQKRKEYLAGRREMTLATRKKWRESNPEKIRTIRKRWNENNLQKLREDRRDFYARNISVNPEFRLLCRLRGRLLKALRGRSKSARTQELLGCGVSELRAHLESQFRPGMTWENYGPVWHIDHIKPCAKFDLTDPAQQRECFNYKNLQPLFAEENLRKSAKYDPR